MENEIMADSQMTVIGTTGGAGLVMHDASWGCSASLLGTLSAFDMNTEHILLHASQLVS